MSKRHTMGVSKWLPSTKDKITFEITLRPSTPDISKHLCIRLVVLYSNDTTQLLQSHDDTTQQQKMRGNVSRFGGVPKPRKEVFNTKHQACHAW